MHFFRLKVPDFRRNALGPRKTFRCGYDAVYEIGNILEREHVVLQACFHRLYKLDAEFDEMIVANARAELQNILMDGQCQDLLSGNM